jgi:GTP-binding protein
MLKIRYVEFVKSSFVTENLIGDDRPKIIFAGRSNVGKSSLINRVLGRRNIARTSSKPGKTVSINYFLINDSAYFVDLPGYGYAKISKGEVNRIKSLISDFFDRTLNIKLVVLLVDSRRGFQNVDVEFVGGIIEKKIRVLTVLTKSDKIKNSDLRNQIKSLEKDFDLKAIPFSVKSPSGSDELLKLINQALIRRDRRVNDLTGF